MKSELKCSVVQDLLPNYIEKLTSEETNTAIEEHLLVCESCKKIYDQMVYEIGNTEKVPAIELKFFKKIKRTRLMAAALCVIVTLSLSYALYASEFEYKNDKGNLSAAITAYTSPFRSKVDAYVLETKEIDGMLVATFKDRTRTNVNGVAFFSRGINNRYRIIKTQLETSNYSSVIQNFYEEIKGKRYYIVSGYNLSEEVKEYGLDYYGYKKPGFLSEDRVKQVLKFDVENQQFLDIYPANEMDDRAKRESNESLYALRLVGTSMYDSAGIETTENLRLDDVNHSGGAGISKAELKLLYVFIAIVIGMGYIITKYILTE